MDCTVNSSTTEMKQAEKPLKSTLNANAVEFVPSNKQYNFGNNNFHCNYINYIEPWNIFENVDVEKCSFLRSAESIQQAIKQQAAMVMDNIECHWKNFPKGRPAHVYTVGEPNRNIDARKKKAHTKEYNIMMKNKESNVANDQNAVPSRKYPIQGKFSEPELPNSTAVNTSSGANSVNAPNEKQSQYNRSANYRGKLLVPEQKSTNINKISASRQERERKIALEALLLVQQRSSRVKMANESSENSQKSERYISYSPIRFTPEERERINRLRDAKKARIERVLKEIANEKLSEERLPQMIVADTPTTTKTNKLKEVKIEKKTEANPLQHTNSLNEGNHIVNEKSNPTNNIYIPPKIHNFDKTKLSVENKPGYQLPSSYMKKKFEEQSNDLYNKKNWRFTNQNEANKENYKPIRKPFNMQRGIYRANIFKELNNNNNNAIHVKTLSNYRSVDYQKNLKSNGVKNNFDYTQSNSVLGESLKAAHNTSASPKQSHDQTQVSSYRRPLFAHKQTFVKNDHSYTNLKTKTDTYQTYAQVASNNNNTSTMEYKEVRGLNLSEFKSNINDFPALNSRYTTDKIMQENARKCTPSDSGIIRYSKNEMLEMMSMSKNLHLSQITQNLDKLKIIRT